MTQRGDCLKVDLVTAAKLKKRDYRKKDVKRGRRGSLEGGPQWRLLPRPTSSHI